MQALKALVIFMGLLIVGAMTVIGYGLYQKSSDPNFKFFNWSESSQNEPSAQTVQPPLRTTAPVASSKPAISFGSALLTLPEGAEIVEMSAEGDRLILRHRTPTGKEAITLVNMNTGAVLGRLDIQASQ